MLPSVALMIVFQALAGVQNSQSLENYLTRAQQLEGRQNYPGAEAVYKEALTAFAQHPEILKRLGLLYQTEHKFNASVEAFQEALRHAPSYTLVNFHLAVSYLSLDRIDEALTALSKELALHPGDRQTRRYLASVYQSLGRKLDALRPQEALPRDGSQAAEGLYQLLTEIRKDLDQHSALALLHVLCAQIYDHSGQYTNAVREYKAALRTRSDFPGAHFSLGRDYWRIARLDDSEEELRRALRDDPRNSGGNYDLASVLAAKQKFPEAIPLLQTSISVQPKFTKAHLLMGRCYASLGDVEKAIQEFSKAIELDPKEPSSHYLLARLYGRLREKEKSEHEFAVFEKLSLQQKQNISRRVDQYVETQGGKGYDP